MHRDPKEIDSLRARLGTVFAKRGDIVAVYLFGSHASAEETARSDIDLGVIYREDCELMAELTLEAEICRVLGTERLDLVNLNKARIGLQFRAIQSGDVIYCADDLARADFVEMVLDRYGDYGLDMHLLARDFLAGLKEANSHGRS